MKNISIGKKLAIGALFVMSAFASFAAGETYHVYKFQFNVKTTDAKGITSAVCGCDEYCFREKRSITIRGVLAGCGCEAIQAANGACKNAILYMWDATRGIAITNVEMTIPWTVQRSGRKATVVEHFAGMKAAYGVDDIYTFDVTMAGFGTYNESKKDSYLSYVSTIRGNFTGTAAAPVYVKTGVCTACYAEPDELFKTTAFSLCTSCTEDGLLESEYCDVTPFFGEYKVAYDTNTSKDVSKNGLARLRKLLPSYVGDMDFVATNIGLDD